MALEAGEQFAGEDDESAPKGLGNGGCLDSVAATHKKSGDLYDPDRCPVRSRVIVRQQCGHRVCPTICQNTKGISLVCS